MATPCRDSGARTDALATSAKMRAASRIRTGPFFATRGGSRVVGTGVRGDAYQIDMRTGTIPGILIGSSILVMASLRSACAPQSLLAQGDLPWNGGRALSLVGQARDLRRATQVDSVFQSYQADARGYVYFFLDRPDNDSSRPTRSRSRSTGRPRGIRSSDWSDSAMRSNSPRTSGITLIT